MAQGRMRKLYRKAPGGPFYVRFQYKGVDQPRCTGTTDEHAAKEKAKRIIDATFLGEVEESRRLKVRGDYAPLTAICAVYLERYGRDARTKRTARGNIGALEKIVRLAGENWTDTRANVLTGELVRRFEAAELQRIERDGRGNMLQHSELRIRTSIGSVLKQARSIFKRATVNWFEQLALPDLTSFREQGVQPPERPRPQPLDQGVIASINNAAPLLEQADPACYVAHLLFSRFGMRNGEIKAARCGWILRTPAGAKLGVTYRPEENFKPKKKTERWIPIAPSVLAAIDRLFVMSPDGDFLVPAANKTERAAIVDRRHSKWAGQWIKDRSKVSYELRRYAGSLVFTKTNSLAHVQQFLGHADMKTTTEWYWYLIGEVPALDMADFAAEPPQFAIVA
jgi:integrase